MRSRYGDEQALASGHAWHGQQAWEHLHYCGTWECTPLIGAMPPDSPEKAPQSSKPGCQAMFHPDAGAA